jgi:hypothetical protein
MQAWAQFKKAAFVRDAFGSPQRKTILFLKFNWLSARRVSFGKQDYPAARPSQPEQQKRAVSFCGRQVEPAASFA